MSTNVRRLLATLAVAVAALAGCSDDDDGDHEVQPPVTTSSTSSTVAEDEEAAAALEVWRKYVVAQAAWLDPPDPAHPDIPQFIARDLLDDFRAGIARELANDIATRQGPEGPTQHHPEVTSSSSTVVVIRDCFVDDSVGYDMDTGDVVDDAVVTRTVEATLVPEDSTWKISQIEEVSKRNGEVTCD